MEERKEEINSVNEEEQPQIQEIVEEKSAVLISEGSHGELSDSQIDENLSN